METIGGNNRQAAVPTCRRRDIRAAQGRSSRYAPVLMSARQQLMWRVEETLDEVTNRVVGPLPRVQAIEALRGYQTMKSASSPFASLNELMVDYRDKLKTMLTGHAQAGQTVRKEDIETFFAELKEQKAH